MSLYKIKPIYKSFIWGGDKLIKKYNLDPKLEKIGTIYTVIAIKGDLDNIVEETGETLSSFYDSHRELFGIDEEVFPVRMTITCNGSLQSYHLHPTDEYALKHEGTKGKVSGSVTLFPDPSGDNSPRKMKFGNKCQSLDEFKQLVAMEDWDDLFNVIEKPVGSFIHTPAGVIHGGQGANMIAGTWGTNGDISYRFFDYHRNDSSRKLYMQETYDCVNIPEIELPKPVIPVPEQIGDMKLLNYYDKGGEYVAKRIQLDGQAEYDYPDFVFYTCADGQGTIDGRPIKAGETLFVPCNYGTITLKGRMDLMLLSYHK